MFGNWLLFQNMQKNKSLISKKIRNGAIGVIPTDTIYGIVASALSKKAVARAYRILERNPKKPFIILISSIRDLTLFNVKPDSETRDMLEKIWPRKVSVILPCPSKKFQYLHRGIQTLAFRVPKKPSLVRFLNETGPLISTSANPEGKKPATTIAEAKSYFGNNIDPVRKTKGLMPEKNSGKLLKSRLSNGVDFYLSNGKMKSLPSTLVEIKNGKLRVVRKGASRISKFLTRKRANKQ